MGTLRSKLSITNRARRAFTLLELMVAFIIMAIFSALAIPVLLSLANASKKGTHKATATTTTLAKISHHPTIVAASFMKTFDAVLLPIGVGAMALLVLVFIITTIAHFTVNSKKRAAARAERTAQALRTYKSAQDASRVPAMSGAMVTPLVSTAPAPFSDINQSLHQEIVRAPIAHKPVGPITRRQQRAQRRLSAQPRFR